MWSREADLGGVHCIDGGAGVETNLQPQRGGAFDMRLHGTRGLRQLKAEDVLHAWLLETGEAGEPRGRAEPAGRGRTEEAQAGVCRGAEEPSDVDTDRHGGQEPAAVDGLTALGFALGPREQGADERRHRVHDGRLVDTVVFERWTK